jgi:hypothetical protein
MDPETERGWNRWFSARLMAVLPPLMEEIGKTTGTLHRELDKLRAARDRCAAGGDREVAAAWAGR